MTDKKRHWFWNLVLVITLVVCLSVLVMHYKNWIKVKPQGIQIVSGFYYVDISYDELDSVVFVARIPPMERLNGFSALEKEKGIFREFKDSSTTKKVHVFVDNIADRKIKLVYKDSVKLYLNLKDSVRTMDLFHQLEEKIEPEEAPN
ncbi:hypothetical protein [Maribacter sp. 2304DJ31-5]|uniref:hypothetical protein n=1 Tax=Maribacter sp. 2304DJ31-5 TaxID=3386273 RepID=UPI0039BCDC00